MKLIDDGELQVIRESGLFDAAWYLERYPDVARLGMEPAAHYLWLGARLGRDPSPDFSSKGYLAANADVAAAGLNPLLHYERFGKSEGRATTSGIVQQPEAVVGDIEFDLVDDPEVSVIVPVYNQCEYTLRCLASLAQVVSDYPFEVIVMDDCSSDSTRERISRIPGVRYHRNSENLGFNRNCNRGAELAIGRYLAFLNNDTEVDPQWLNTLRRTFGEHDRVGVVGSKLVYADNRLQEAGGIIWQDGSGWNWGRLNDPAHPRYNFVRDVDYVSGASIMVPRELFFELGCFSEKLVNAYYEDTWLAFAAREAGYRVLYQPRSQLIHYEGVTSGTDVTTGVKRYQETNREVFVDRWKPLLVHHLENGANPELASDREVRGHVLIIDACTPTPDRDSGSLDMLNLIRILLDENYRVHFIPQHNFLNFGEYTARLQAMGVECIYHPYYDSVRQYLLERGDMFSHVIMARLPVAKEVLDDVIDLAPTARTIFYTVDLHGLRAVREAELTGEEELLDEARRELEDELSLVRRSDVTIVLSEYEAEFLRKRGHDRLAIVPLIRDCSRLPDCPPFEERDGAVFIGGFQHTPNIDAVQWLVDEIWPALREIRAREGVPPIELKIIGSSMPDWIAALDEPDIAPVGFVADLDEIFCNTRVAVAPLRYGAGLKGKIATAMQYGVPTVGTGIAFEGMPVEGLELVRNAANSADAIARAIHQVVSDPDAWLDSSRAARDYVQRHFSTSAATRTIRRVLDLEKHEPIAA